jgi:hypothetical protein
MYLHTVTSKLVSGRRPKYAQATIETLLEEIFSMWSAPCLVIGNRPMNTHSDNIRGVFYVVGAMSNAG